MIRSARDRASDTDCVHDIDAKLPTSHFTYTVATSRRRCSPCMLHDQPRSARKLAIVGTITTQDVMTVGLWLSRATSRWVKGEGAEGLARHSGSLTSAPPETGPTPGSRALAFSGAHFGVALLHGFCRRRGSRGARSRVPAADPWLFRPRVLCVAAAREGRVLRTH